MPVEGQMFQVNPPVKIDTSLTCALAHASISLSGWHSAYLLLHRTIRLLRILLKPFLHL